MIQITNMQTYGWEAAIRGMRNPMNSWGESDSGAPNLKKCFNCPTGLDEDLICDKPKIDGMCLGPNDLSLMLKLAKAGTDHAKYRRMITVTMDILAPLYWWKEFDTYKVGTVANSCSTMHKITEKEFTIDDFSHEHLIKESVIYKSGCFIETYSHDAYSPYELLDAVVEMLNKARSKFLETNEKKYWWQIIQLLPSSYNQLRTVQLNYEVLANIYHSRREHKLDEWREFCAEIEKLPYSEIYGAGAAWLLMKAEGPEALEKAATEILRRPMFH